MPKGVHVTAGQRALIAAGRELHYTDQETANFAGVSARSVARYAKVLEKLPEKALATIKSKLGDQYRVNSLHLVASGVRDEQKMSPYQRVIAGSALIDKAMLLDGKSAGPSVTILLNVPGVPQRDVVVSGAIETSAQALPADANTTQADAVKAR